jgi:serine-type D-Ala-D-Ala carboxypeptidase (penicillin-binding protein 5/6)
MKRIFNNIAKVFLCSIFLTAFSSSFVKAETTLPPVYSEGAILMDGRTGEILYSKNEHVQYEPASTTKVMTALVVLENVKLSDMVTIGQNPTLVEGSAIGVAEGEIYSVEELLLGLLLESGNDCAEALAEFVSGSVEEFSKLMNAKAKEIGALDTTFKNPHGLHEDGHVTTAYDLALIMNEAIKNEDYVRISRTDTHFYENHPFSDGSEKWAINRNQLFNEFTYFYEYAYTGKNGYTPEANHTYTASAIKDGQLLVSAFLNATEKDNFYSNVGPLFDYGFDNFETVKLINKDEVLANFDIDEKTSIPLLASKEIYYTKSRFNTIPIYALSYDTSSINLDEIDVINSGDILFKATVNVDGQAVSTIDLLSGQNYENNSILGVIKDSNILSIVLYVLVLLLILIIIISTIHSIKLKRVRRRRPTFKSRNRYR